MLDIQLLRKDLDQVIARLQTRKNPQAFLDVEAFSKLEAERKTLQSHTEQLQNQRNVLSKQIGQAKARGESTDELMQEVANLKDALDQAQVRNDEVQAALKALLLQVPNLPQADVPVGVDETGNQILSRWGEPRQFDFPVKDHVDLGAVLGSDPEMGVKLAGSRFTFLQGPLARLHRALAQFMLDMHVQKHGYTECYTPYIVNAQTLQGTGQLPKLEDDMFSVKKGGQEGAGEVFYLIPTSEVTLTNTVRDTLLAEQDLPIRLTAHTPCFRSEAGSAGKDTRGLIRQHQFDKVEMVHIVRPEESDDALQTMVGHAKAVLEALELPYRVMMLCTGDMGFAAAKTYDLEVWLPAQNAYREISSCSNCEAFQARRLQARYKNAQGKNELVHTLNGSGVAVGRAMVAVLENHQNADGSIYIPQALRPYFGGEAILTLGKKAE